MNQFWGVRSSIPSPGSETPRGRQHQLGCSQLRLDPYLAMQAPACDAWETSCAPAPRSSLASLHWDHIQGLAFAPLYLRRPS
jgi:phosphoribosyl 1,2-cyclic phosphodiesterase